MTDKILRSPLKPTKPWNPKECVSVGRRLTSVLRQDDILHSSEHEHLQTASAGFLRGWRGASLYRVISACPFYKYSFPRTMESEVTKCSPLEEPQAVTHCAVWAAVRRRRSERDKDMKCYLSGAVTTAALTNTGQFPHQMRRQHYITVIYNISQMIIWHLTTLYFFRKKKSLLKDSLIHRIFWNQLNSYYNYLQWTSIKFTSKHY